jgi:hypothetical protein
MFKKKGIIIAIILVVLLGITGFAVYKTVFNSKPSKQVKLQNEPSTTPEPQIDASISVDIEKSKTKDDTIALSVKGLKSKMASVGYEITYDSEGLIKGVNSGSNPIDISGKDEFAREIYLGTCSRNVCKPDVGVKTVTVALEFTDTSGAKSQFSKDFNL